MLRWPADVLAVGWLGMWLAFTISCTPVIREIEPPAPVIWMEYVPVGVFAVVAIVRMAVLDPLGFPDCAAQETAVGLRAMFEAGGKGKPLSAPVDRLTVPENPGSQFIAMPYCAVPPGVTVCWGAPDKENGCNDTTWTPSWTERVKFCPPSEEAVAPTWFKG